MDGTEKPEKEINGAFSMKNPLLQIVWDATSLGTFKECPRKYYLQVVRGYTTKQSALALDFGIIFHEGLESSIVERRTEFPLKRMLGRPSSNSSVIHFEPM